MAARKKPTPKAAPRGAAQKPAGLPARKIPTGQGLVPMLPAPPAKPAPAAAAA